MESLLSLSFDNISSRNQTKISKGLRQIEGLLAQICILPRSRTPSAHSTRSSRSSETPNHQASQNVTTLDVLSEDLAFREFFRLQESFEWNVATRLTECLERLLGMRSTQQSDDLIRAALAVLQGTLLLHPQSRSLFARENHMSLLLDLLDPHSASPDTLAATLLVLTTALLDHPANIRLFEALDGLGTVSGLWRSTLADVLQTGGAGLPAPVASLCRDFLAFYLMPEAVSASSTPYTGMAPPSSSPSHTQPRSRRYGSDGRSLASATTRSDGSVASTGQASTANSIGSRGSSSTAVSSSLTRSTEEKRKLLGKCLDADAAQHLAELRGSWTLERAAAV